jgi:hypothetical protein
MAYEKVDPLEGLATSNNISSFSKNNRARENIPFLFM